MKVNRDTLKIDYTTLTRGEAEAFIECLMDERARHQGDLLNAETDKYARQSCLHSVNKNYHRLKAVFWATAVKRHQIDIDEIDALIGAVKMRYDL